MHYSPKDTFYPVIAAVAAAGVLALPPALAQEEDTEAPAAAQTESPWDTRCSQPERRAEPSCEMTQTVVVPDSRQVLLRVEVEIPAGDAGPRMVLQLPHGIYLPAGITLEIDEQEWQETVVQTCDGNGCYAGFPVDEASLERLQGGAQMTVGFQSLAREGMRVPVDLSGFTAAYNRIR